MCLHTLLRLSDAMYVNSMAVIKLIVYLIIGTVNRSYPILYELFPTSTCVCVNCTFLDTSNSPLEYVAVVQLKSSVQITPEGR